MGIPLFSYLCHEYAICYGGDSAHIGPGGIPVIPWWVRKHAVNLVTGTTPGAATWNYPEQLEKADATILTLVRNHRRFLDAGASRFLMEGRMLHPFRIETQTLSYSGSEWEMPGRGAFYESAILSEAGGGFQPLWKEVAFPKKYSTVIAPDEILFLGLREPFRRRHGHSKESFVGTQRNPRQARSDIRLDVECGVSDEAALLG